MTQSRSDLKELNVACSFPVETEQDEIDPDGNGADEMVTDETHLDDEIGGDSGQLFRLLVDVEPEKGESEYP